MSHSFDATRGVVVVPAELWWRHPWPCRSANTKNSLRTTARYIDAFFANIRWDVAAARAEAR